MCENCSVCKHSVCFLFAAELTQANNKATWSPYCPIKYSICGIIKDKFDQKRNIRVIQSTSQTYTRANCSFESTNFRWRHRSHYFKYWFFCLRRLMRWLSGCQDTHQSDRVVMKPRGMKLHWDLLAQREIDRWVTDSRSETWQRSDWSHLCRTKQTYTLQLATL